MFFKRSVAMHHAKRATLTAALAVSVLALSGCEEWDDLVGNDKKSSSGAAAAPAPTTTSLTGNPDAESATGTNNIAAVAADVGENPDRLPGALSTGAFAATGSVWKPVSEGDGNLVVLTPATFPTLSTRLLRGDGSTICSGRNAGRTNGNRPTYRFCSPGGGLPNPVYFQLGSNVYRIDNPGNRIN